MPSKRGATPDREHEHRAGEDATREQTDCATQTGKVLVADSGFEQAPVGR